MGAELGAELGAESDPGSSAARARSRDSRQPLEASRLSHEWPRTRTPPMARAAREGGERSTVTSGVIIAVMLSQ